MERILVTGATGRVGANLIAKLLEKGYEVKAFTMKNDPQLLKLKAYPVEIAEGSLTDKDDVEAAMEGCDIVIHLAASMVLGNTPERKFWDINATGTFEVVRAAVHKKIKRLLMASTDATYTCWNPVYTPIDETHPQRPFFLYGMTKKVCEDILFSAMRETGLPVVAMRFSNVKCCDEILDAFTVKTLAARLRGYSAHPSSVVYCSSQQHPEQQIADLMEDPDGLIIPRGQDYRSWMEHHVDVRDLIHGILLCLEKDEAVGQAFNLAAPEPSCWEAAVKLISEKTNLPYYERRIDNFWSYSMSIEKAKAVLGYRPQYTLERMIDDALAYRNGADLNLIPPVI